MGYQILRLQHQAYGRRPIIAKMIGRPPIQLADAIWRPEVLPFDPVLRFTVGKAALLPDFLATGDIFWLISLKLADLLRGAGAHLDTYPVALSDRKTAKPLHSTHGLFHLRQVEPIVDLGQSIYRSKTWVESIHLSSIADIPENSLIRDSFFKSLVFVRDDLLDLLCGAGTTGIYWQKVEDYSIRLHSGIGDQSRASHKR